MGINKDNERLSSESADPGRLDVCADVADEFQVTMLIPGSVGLLANCCCVLLE